VLVRWEPYLACPLTDALAQGVDLKIGNPKRSYEATGRNSIAWQCNRVFWAGGTGSHDEDVIPVDKRRAHLGSAEWIIRAGMRKCCDRAGPCRCAHGPVVASRSEHAPPLA
jgi:hypothetical protein